MTEQNPNQFDLGALAADVVSTYKGDSGGYTGRCEVTRENIHSTVQELLQILRSDLAEQIELALRHQCQLKSCSTCDCTDLASRYADDLLGKVPQIRETLKTDIQAAYDGDPAAHSFEEVVISYPYINAISIYRMPIPRRGSISIPEPGSGITSSSITAPVL
jgi:hypothetical protein